MKQRNMISHLIDENSSTISIFNLQKLLVRMRFYHSGKGFMLERSLRHQNLCAISFIVVDVIFLNSKYYLSIGALFVIYKDVEKTFSFLSIFPKVLTIYK